MWFHFISFPLPVVHLLSSDLSTFSAFGPDCAERYTGRQASPQHVLAKFSVSLCHSLCSENDFFPPIELTKTEILLHVPTINYFFVFGSNLLDCLLVTLQLFYPAVHRPGSWPSGLNGSEISLVHFAKLRSTPNVLNLSRTSQPISEWRSYESWTTAAAAAPNN